MRQLFIVLIVTISVSGCALQNVQLYKGDPLPDSEQATISAVGIYHERDLSLQITEVDGASVSTNRSASFLVLPGKHEVKVHAQKDLFVSSSRISYKEADIKTMVSVKKGHTYIPDAITDGKRIRVYFDDKGIGFPRECLPLYIAINNSTNPGAMLYATDKKCELPKD